MYEVVVTNSSGCSATQSITVEEPNCLTEAGKNTAAKVITTIMDPIKLNQVQFFPNPTTGLVTVHDKNETFQPSLLAVYSAQGQLMQEIPLLDRQRQIDLSDYSKGMYIVKITRERSVGIQKIMVDGGR